MTMKVLSRFYVALAGLSLAACGPAFTTAAESAGDGAAVVLGGDAGAPSVGEDASDAGEKKVLRREDDAGATLEASRPRPDADASQPDAAEAADAPSPVEAAPPPPPVDAGHEAAPPPPPPLCCATPCSGITIADIACTSSQPWTCGAGSCTADACTAGAVCHWMGTTCTGTVEVCP
jgi:hypothetical protein